jgi:hypothetical protein
MLTRTNKLFGGGLVAVISVFAAASATHAGIILSGESRAFGSSSGVTALDGAANFAVEPTAVSEGSAPPAYSTSASEVDFSASASLIPGLTLGTMSGTFHTTAASTVDGDFSCKQTEATATANGYSLTLVTQEVPLDSFLILNATRIDSSAEVIGRAGILNASGRSTFENVSLTVAESEIDMSLFINASGEAEPNTILDESVHGVSGLAIILNEQNLSGDGATEAGIAVNAMRIILADVDSGVTGVGLLNGEVTIAHSQAKHTSQPACPQDLTGDGIVDGADLLILLSQWGPCGDPDDCSADLNCDGVVDGADLLLLLSAWGECPA